MAVVLQSTNYSLDEFCRLCATESKYGINIYSPEGHEQCLEEKINYCFRIEVSQNDLLPKFVCNSCHSRLEDCHKFAEEVNRVQNTLETLIQMKNFENANSNMSAELENVKLELIIEDENENEYENENENEYENENESESNFNDFMPDKLISPSIESNIDTIMFENIAIDNIIKSENVDEATDLCLGISESETCNLLKQQLKTRINKIVNKKVKPKKNNKLHETSDFEGNVGIDLDSSSLCEDISDNQTKEEKIKEDVQNNLGIKCNQCDIVLSFKSQFDSHYRNSYNKTPVYTCSFCNKTIEKYSTFRSHCYRHLTEGRYRCEYCEKGFNLRTLLDFHIAAKHTEVKPFTCESCGKGFVTHSALNSHVKSHENLQFPCKECGKILFSQGGLTSHMNVHKLGRRFMCDLCGKTFTQKVNMQHHVKLHYGERPYTCEKCGKGFAEKSHLNRHYIYHSEKRPFKCLVCSKMYKTERCLKVHNRVHAEARPFVCSYCNKGFLSVTKLKQHCNIHTGERPYKCRYCDRTFTNFPNWLKHTKRTHKVDHKTGLSINGKEEIVKRKTLPSSNHIAAGEDNKMILNSDLGEDDKQSTENPSLQSQTFSYTSFLNPVPTPSSPVYSDQNLITHMVISPMLNL